MSSPVSDPKPIKGAFVMNPDSGQPTAIIFQYNPTSLTRKLTPNKTGQNQENLGSKRLAGPPSQSIDLTVKVDATDQLNRGSEQAQKMGIHPQLAALETMLYPDVEQIKSVVSRLSAGEIEVIPPSSPIILFVWGGKRVLPVDISSFNITEQEYDPDLNPIRAEVSLSLEVLTTSHFSTSHPGFHIHMANQVFKEAMAQVAQANDMSRMGNMLP